jgi:N-glycosylase/DNA lyase
LAVRPFDFDLVVRSHGWWDLPPFVYDAPARKLSFRFLASGEPVRVTVAERASGISICSDADSPGSEALVRAVVERVLDLRADLTGFHGLCLGRDGFGWIAERGAGRMLRAPTLFEDAVKVLATTNCSWGLTRAIVANLIASYGKDGAFPPPEFAAGLSEKRLREEVRLGYRAPFLATFATRVASGALDLSRWEEAGRPDEEIEREIRAENGFGPYAADTIGRLLGRHAKLGIDSWSRKKVSNLRFRGRRVPDARIEKLYRPFGRWAGLAFWLDVTREWHDGLESLAATEAPSLA